MEKLDVERWRDLCELAAREQDRQKLQALVLELTKLIEKEISARATEECTVTSPCGSCLVVYACESAL
jgi:hypothetical protein